MKRELYNRILDSLVSKAKEILPVGSQLTLYGSQARGDATSDSDWDLHLLIPGPEQLSIDEMMKYVIPFSDTGMEFGEVVNTAVYTFDGWMKRQFLPYFHNVNKEGITIFKN